MSQPHFLLLGLGSCLLICVQATRWKYGCPMSLGQRCYWMSDDQKPYVESVGACALEDGRMVHAQNQDVLNLLISMAETKPSPTYRAFWTDATDQQTEGDFRRLDGAPTWVKWDTIYGVQPNGGLLQDCMASPEKYGWRQHDKPCDELYFYACEYITPSDPVDTKRMYTYRGEGVQGVHSRYAFLSTSVHSPKACGMVCAGYLHCTKFYVSPTPGTDGAFACMLVHWDIPLDNPKSPAFYPERQAYVFTKIYVDTNLDDY